jgi:maltose/moltooligosaccharide transporter
VPLSAICCGRIQTAFIGAGAVVGSIFPYLLDHFGVANIAPEGQIADTVKFSFWFGGVILFLAVLWTVLTTREYSPAEMEAFDGPDEDSGGTLRALASRSSTGALIWIGAGIAVMALVELAGLEKEMYLLGGLLAAYGIASMFAINIAKSGKSHNVLSHIVGDFSGMPEIMKKLAVAQFFSWSALFIMWIYTTPVVAQYMFGSADPASAAYGEGGTWVGTLFAVYNGVAALAALFLLPAMARRFGKVKTHIMCLLAGSAGYASFLVIRDPNVLIISEIGVGIAWASILAMPYAILASSLPQRKLGIYMGLFNVFIVVPQLLVATVMGSVLKAFFPTEPIWTMVFAAVVMAIAAIAMLRVKEASD